MLTLVGLAVLVAVTALLIGFAAGAAYGGRHTAQQSHRADREKRGREQAEHDTRRWRNVAEQTDRQFRAYRKAIAHPAGRKQAGRG